MVPNGVTPSDATHPRGVPLGAAPETPAPALEQTCAARVDKLSVPPWPGRPLSGVAVLEQTGQCIHQTVCRIGIKELKNFS